MMRAKRPTGRPARGMLATWLCGLSFVMVLALHARPVAAHELEETAATLVVREGGALELRLVCTWSRLLLTNSGATTSDAIREQLGRLAAEPASVFATRVQTLRRSIETGVRAHTGGDGRLRFEAWQWPATSDIQEALRQELMATMTGASGDHHASRLMVTARLVVGPTAPTVRLEMPKQLGPVLLTIVRPQEQWLAPGQLSPAVVLRSR